MWEEIGLNDLTLEELIAWAAQGPWGVQLIGGSLDRERWEIGQEGMPPVAIADSEARARQLAAIPSLAAEVLRLRALLASEGYIGYDLPPASPSSSHSYRLADDDAPTGGPGPGPGAEG